MTIDHPRNARRFDNLWNGVAKAMVEIVGVMFGLGLLLGFVGAGGSGFIVALLTVAFGYSIHIASGTALAAMVFSTFSGAISHFRSGHVAIKPGLTIGAAGAVGSLFTAQIAVRMPQADLKTLTASVLFLSALVMFARLALFQRRVAQSKVLSQRRGPGYWLLCLAMGLIVGGISGTFGIGSAPFIQLGLLLMLGLPLADVPGTTMLIIIPTALAGAIGYYHAGYLDFRLLGEVVAGTVAGSYIGATFTSRLPPAALKFAMVLVPMVGASILLG